MIPSRHDPRAVRCRCPRCLAAGCTDESPSNSDTISFDHDHLSCPEDTLLISVDNGFDAGVTVTFIMGDMRFDGDAVILNSGSIACGLPANAPAGSYDVEVNDPDLGDVTIQDAVTLDSSTCPDAT